jgi:hypothetical protein
MRIRWAALALLAIGGDATAADVTAYVVSTGPATPYYAERVASLILKKAGVNVEWRRDLPRTAPTSPLLLRIELTTDAPADFVPGALAVAYPYAGGSKSITVFLDRVRARANGAGHESVFLAYVLAHEITHVVQGLARHSESGVMKEHWSAEDQKAILAMRLDFAEDDLRFIRQGLASLWRRTPKTLTRRSESGTAAHPG